MDSTQHLTGRVALVTGASRGIGRAIARRLAAADAQVVVTARSATRPARSHRFGQEQVAAGTLAETVSLIEAAGGTAIALAADLEDAAARATLVERVVAATGRLDILVNNAGFADYARIETMATDTIERTITHYLRAPLDLIQQAIPHLRAAGAGWIVNIGSITAMPPVRPYGDYARAGGDVLYAAMKAAMHRLTQGLAAELVDHNIAVNAVGPSTAIRTPGADALIPADYPTEDVAYLAQTVLAMCHLPAAQRTGLLAFSMHYPKHVGLEVTSLDGTTVLPEAAIPPTAHPATPLSGE